PLLFAEVEGGHDLAVTVEAGLLQVVQEATALRDELQEPAARVVVLHVGLEVLREVADALAEEGDLHLGRPGVALVGLELADQLGLFLGLKRHFSSWDWAFGSEEPPRPRRLFMKRPFVSLDGFPGSGRAV